MFHLIFIFWRCGWNIVFRYPKNRQINKCGYIFSFIVIISSLLSKSDLCLPTHCTCRGLLLPLITLSDTLSHSVWLLWTRDRPVTEPTHHNHKRQKLVPPAGSKPTVQASVRPQTYAIVCAVTGISVCRHCTANIKCSIFKIRADKA
jgi:hypothetical protein